MSAATGNSPVQYLDSRSDIKVGNFDGLDLSLGQLADQDRGLHRPAWLRRLDGRRRSIDEFHRQHGADSQRPGRQQGLVLADGGEVRMPRAWRRHNDGQAARL